MGRLQVAGLLIVIISMVFSSCSKRKLSEQELFSYAIEAQFAKIAREKYQLRLTGTGGGIWEKIRAIDMYFTYHQKVSVEEARELVVHFTNDCLEVIRANKDSEKYIEYDPAPLKVLKIVVGFRERETSDRREGFCIIGNYGGELVYGILDPDIPNKMGSIIFLRENFEEASRIVAEEDRLNGQVRETKCVAY